MIFYTIIKCHIINKARLFEKYLYFNVKNQINNYNFINDDYNDFRSKYYKNS